MNKGFLSQYFNGVAIKTLSSVEADLIISHQHEFNGIKELKNILGEPHDKVKFKTQFMYLSDTNNEPLIETGFLTWYDAREKARLERNVMRYEYRLYFSSSKVIEASKTDDVLIIAKKNRWYSFSNLSRKQFNYCKSTYLVVWYYSFQKFKIFN